MTSREKDVAAVGKKEWVAGRVLQTLVGIVVAGVTMVMATAMNATAANLCEIPSSLLFADGPKTQKALARSDWSMTLAAYEFTEKKDGLSALLVGFGRGDGPEKGTCDEVGVFRFCPTPRDGDDLHEIGFKFTVVGGQLPNGLVLPKEALGVSFPQNETDLLGGRCVNVYWIDDLSSFTAKLDVMLVDRKGQEIGRFDLDVRGYATERREPPSIVADLWDDYGKKLVAGIVVLFMVGGIVGRIRYYYRVARGKQK